MNTKLWRIAEKCWSPYPSGRPTSRVISTHLQEILSPLRTLTDTFVLSSGLTLSEVTAASVLSAVARMSQEASSDSKLGLNNVRDVIDALYHLGYRYRPAVVRSAARGIAMKDPALADQLMTKLSSPELRLSQRGHTSVSSVAFLPDGCRLVSSSDDRTLRIWNIKTGETVTGPLRGHTRTVPCVAVHGSRIVSCSYDGTFRVWDADSGELVLGPIMAHDGGKVNCIAYSRDGACIATTGDDNCAAVWDASTGVRLREMSGHTDRVMCVAFSEDGKRLASGSQDTTVRIWDVASGECIGEPFTAATGHLNSVTAVCFSPDDKRIFTSSLDCKIRIWDAGTRALIVEPLSMDGWVLCLALSPDGKRLVSGGKIAIWDAQTGAAIPAPFKDYKGLVRGVAFSPDGRKIASASDDGTITLWDATDDWKRYELSDNVKHLLDALSRGIPQALTHEDLAALYSLTGSNYGQETLFNLHTEAGYPDSRPIALLLLACLSLQLTHEGASTARFPSAVAAARAVIHTIEVLDLRLPPSDLRRLARALATHDRDMSDELMAKISSPELRSPLRGHTGALGSVAFLPDGCHIVSTSTDRTLRIWDIETGETVIDASEGHTDNIRCAACHGSRIASCSYDGTFRVWDADSGKVILGPISAHKGKWLNWIAYSRDGTHIATAGQDNRAILWDANTGVQMREMIGHAAPVMCVAFSEDGTHLVSGSQDETVRIWEVSSGECVGEPLTGHTLWVTAVCFSPDDKRIFSSSSDATIRIWDTETRAPAAEPKRMDHQVLSMALSPDGKRLVSGSHTGRITMWDAETGAAIPTPFKDHGAEVWDLAFSPDGRKLASASKDMTIALWDATDDWKRYDIDDEDAEKDNV